LTFCKNLWRLCDLHSGNHALLCIYLKKYILLFLLFELTKRCRQYLYTDTHHLMLWKDIVFLVYSIGGVMRMFCLKLLYYMNILDISSRDTFFFYKSHHLILFFLFFCFLLFFCFNIIQNRYKLCLICSKRLRNYIHEENSPT